MKTSVYLLFSTSFPVQAINPKANISLGYTWKCVTFRNIQREMFALPILELQISSSTIRQLFCCNFNIYFHNFCDDMVSVSWWLMQGRVSTLRSIRCRCTLPGKVQSPKYVSTPESVPWIHRANHNANVNIKPEVKWATINNTQAVD